MSFSTEITNKSQPITLSQFMSKVYLWMMLGMLLSTGIAVYISNQPYLARAIIGSSLLFNGLIIAQLACVFAFSFLQSRVGPITAMTLFIAYSCLTGVTLSVIFFAYTQQSIFQALAVTTISFLGLSIFGYTTKRDLGPIGTFCMMGLFGLIGYFLLSLFIPSLNGNTMQMVTAAIGVIVFSGLTAYDTQKIKSNYAALANQGENTLSKAAISGALMLYLDFINLFLSLLRLFGSRQ